MGHSLRRFPLALPWERRGSVSGARRAGLLMTSNVDRCSVNAGKDRFPPALLWELRGSVSGAWRTGFSSTTSDDRRGIHAGKTDSKDENGARR